MKSIEVVTWRDSVQLGGWQRVEDMVDWAGRVITTIGYVIHENEDDLVMAMSAGDIQEDALYCNWMSIPKCCIKSRASIDVAEATEHKEPVPWPLKIKTMDELKNNSADARIEERFQAILRR